MKNPPSIPEKDFQKRVTDLCDWYGLLWYHPNDSRRDNAGFPDLVIVGPGGAVFAELKTETGRVSTAQAKWHKALLLSGCDSHIWRPGDWEQIVSKLKYLSVGHNVNEGRTASWRS